MPKEIKQSPLSDEKRFSREWRPAHEKYPVDAGDHIAIVGLKTAVRLSESQQSALVSALEAITGVQQARVAFVATVPAPPGNARLFVGLEGSIKAEVSR